MYVPVAVSDASWWLCTLVAVQDASSQSCIIVDGCVVEAVEDRASQSWIIADVC